MNAETLPTVLFQDEGIPERAKVLDKHHPVRRFFYDRGSGLFVERRHGQVKRFLSRCCVALREFRRGEDKASSGFARRISKVLPEVSADDITNSGHRAF